MRFLTDYPEEHRGNIVGLAEKSIAWHRTVAEQQAEKMIKDLGGRRETARPPIDPPDDERITFLSTVEEIAFEGSVMNNCVASYARRAVRGHSLLFHVEHNRGAATVEVSPQGASSRLPGPETTSTPLRSGAKRRWIAGARSFPRSSPARGQL